MRYVRYAFLGTLGIILISVSLANRGLVDLQLMPEAIARIVGFNPTITLPLFVLVLGGIAAGLVIGFFWEWLREYKLRRDAGQKAREVRTLEREVTRLKGERDQVIECRPNRGRLRLSGTVWSKPAGRRLFLAIGLVAGFASATNRHEGRA